MESVELTFKLFIYLHIYYILIIRSIDILTIIFIFLYHRSF